MRTPKLNPAETLTAINRYAADRNRAAVYRVTAYAEQESAYGVAPGFGDVARAGRSALAALRLEERSPEDIATEFAGDLCICCGVDLAR